MYYAMHICNIVVKMDEEMFTYTVFVLWNALKIKAKNVLLRIIFKVCYNRLMLRICCLIFHRFIMIFFFLLSDVSNT